MKAGLKRALKLCLLSIALAHAGMAVSQIRPHKVTVMHAFNGADGRQPQGQLLELEDGVFYGTTTIGGSRGGGTVFRITASGTLMKLFEFGEHASSFEGSYPSAGLTLGSDGNLYGTTSLGGDLGSGIAGGYGTVYRMTPQGVLTVLQTFVGTNGAQPFAPLVNASDGNLYGVTYASSISSGALFRVTADGSVTSIHEFATDDALSEGAQFSSGLTQGPDGNLYGAGMSGGYGLVPNGGGGVLFRATLDGIVTPLHYFPFISGPHGVVFDGNGTLFGVTVGSHPILYKLDTTALFEEVYRFACSCGVPEGASPVHPPILASDGVFYGTTAGGGVHNKGTIYAMSPEGVVTPVHSFSDAEGHAPAARLLEGRDGRFYGSTRGENLNFGTIFKLAFVPAAAPTALTATAGSGRVILNWNPVRTTDSYDVYSATSSGGSNATPVSTVTTTSADVTGLTNGTTYYFKVVPKNEAGSGPASSEVSAMPITAPSGLAATVGDSTVTLRWVAAEGASSYNLYQGESPLTATAVPVRTNIMGTSTTINALVNGRTYHFKVASVYGTTEGPHSPEITAVARAVESRSSGGGGGGLDLLLIGCLGAVAASCTKRRRGVLRGFRNIANRPAAARV